MSVIVEVEHVHHNCILCFLELALVNDEASVRTTIAQPEG